MEIGLKSCYLAVLPDSKFSVCVWIFFPVPQDLWLDCCTAGGKTKVWTKVKSPWEHRECPFWEHALSADLTTKKQLSLHTPLQFQAAAQTHQFHWRKSSTSPSCFIPVTHAPNVCMKWPTLALHHTKIHSIFFSVALRFASMQLTAMFNLKSQPSSSLMESL